MKRVILPALLLASHGFAQTAPAPMSMPGAAAAPCPATPPKLAPELAGWSSAVPMPAAASGQELGVATLTVGAAVKAALHPSAAVAFALPPEHAPPSGSNGGLFAFTVTQAGRFRVALGAGVWVDVVKDGRAMATSAHGHGPDCTGIRKMVDYQLQPGRYTLQLSGATAPTLQVMVARLAV
jgi:hypothetical protein